MKLIEKKCPNCGAGLEFKDSDKSCKCAHCGSSFEIERDKSIDNLNDQFDLKPLDKAFSILSFVIFIVIFAVAACFIAVVSHIVFSNSKSNTLDDSSDDVISDIISDFNKEEEFIKDVSQLSNSDISHIENRSETKISYRGEGVNDAHHSYNRSGEPRREKLYVAYKNDGNYIISIYKVNYHDFFHQENSYTVYVPIVFENVKGDIAFDLGDGEVRAPEYYFNSEKTSYTYGYASFDEAYNGVVKPLENDYKITEK